MASFDYLEVRRQQDEYLSFASQVSDGQYYHYLHTPAIGLDDPIAQLHSSKAFRSLLPPIDTTDLGPTALCGPCTWTYATTNQQQWYNITTEVYSEEDSIEDEIPSIIRTATDNSPWTAPATYRSAHRTTSSPSIASPEGSGRGLCDSRDRTSSASLSLEDFVVGRCLSRGSTDGSTMFLARDKRTARPLVLQCYPAPLFDGVDEAEVVPRLEHRLRAYREVSRRFRPVQVVELLDFFWDSAGLILVMERLDGSPVKDVLRQRSNHVMSEEEVKQVLRHVLEVLRGLHQHHMVHGSLRPSHVWRTDGSIVLTGMLAHLASSIFSTYGCTRPIIDYAAPEQLRSGHRGTVTPATDLWQVGVLGYELLCGCLPFEHVSERLTMEYISEGVAFYPSFLSSDAQSFLATLLCVDEADRPTADDALRHPFLQTVQSGSREACEATPALVRPLFAHSTPPPPTEATPCTEADLSHGSRPRSTQGSHLNPGASHSVLSNSPDAVPVTSIGMPGMGGVSTQQPKNVRAHDLYPSTLWSEVTVSASTSSNDSRRQSLASAATVFHPSTSAVGLSNNSLTLCVSSLSAPSMDCLSARSSMTDVRERSSPAPEVLPVMSAPSAAHVNLVQRGKEQRESGSRSAEGVTSTQGESIARSWSEGTSVSHRPSYNGADLPPSAQAVLQSGVAVVVKRRASVGEIVQPRSNQPATQTPQERHQLPNALSCAQQLHFCTSSGSSSGRDESDDDSCDDSTSTSSVIVSHPPPSFFSQPPSQGTPTGEPEGLQW